MSDTREYGSPQGGISGSDLVFGQVSGMLVGGMAAMGLAGLALLWDAAGWACSLVMLAPVFAGVGGILGTLWGSRAK